jgi:hypothetical protein
MWYSPDAIVLMTVSEAFLEKVPTFSEFFRDACSLDQAASNAPHFHEVNRHDFAILVAQSFALFHIPNVLVGFSSPEHSSRHAEALGEHLSVGPYILGCSEAASSFRSLLG